MSPSLSTPPVEADVCPPWASYLSFAFPRRCQQVFAHAYMTQYYNIMIKKYGLDLSFYLSIYV